MVSGVAPFIDAVGRHRNWDLATDSSRA